MATIHKLTKDGATIFPATITDAVVHPQTGKTLTSMIKDYNVSELFPTEGIDGGNKYNLALAIQVLGTHLSAAQKTGGIKLTFISSVSPYPEEEYYLGKSSWSGNASDWDQRFEVGDVVADPSGSWEPSTAEQYIDQQIATVTGNLTQETIGRQTGDRNLQIQLNSEMATRADQDANLNALINAGIREGGGVQFDTVPTQNSANGITSGGMYSTLKDSNIGFVDDEPTAGSDNLVKSGSIKACMDSKIDIESINLYNTEDFLPNKSIDRQGNIIDNDGGGSVSNYIPINGKNITFNLIFNRYNSIAVYNEDYTFRRVILTEDYYTQYTYTYQAGDSYIRVCVLNNQVKMAFYGNSMKNYTPFNPIAKYLLNAKPYFAITNNLELNKRIKELYIEGSLNPSKYYGVYSCYHYNGRYQFYIMQSDTPDLTGTDIVACYDSDQRPEGVIELESFVNNVKAYGVFSCIDEEQPYQYRELINIPYVQDLAYSPAIYLWLLERQKNVYVDKLGSGDFTKLSDAISYSLLHKDVVINIAPGEYDLVDELGADYFANMTNEYYQGLKLGNGVTLRATGNGVVIKALYNGNNVNVGYQYSLFNIIGTCTVENISFIAYNTRYVIHDDLDTVHYPDVKDYIVSFKGCRFNHKGSTMYDITQSVPISIGGGCVKNSTHIFEECIFESEADIVTEDLSYHNSYDCNSKVTINNCYFGGDKTIAGRASELTSGTVNWFVSNNRFGNQPKLYNPELIHVIEFGNIIDS